MPAWLLFQAGGRAEPAEARDAKVADALVGVAMIR
jgi:hypothetical protein